VRRAGLLRRHGRSGTRFPAPPTPGGRVENCYIGRANCSSLNDSGPLVNASLCPKLRNWPCFRHFRVSPFRADSHLNGQPCAPAPFAGGRFSPSPNGNQELVNGAARVVRPQAGRAETGPRISLTSTAEHRAGPIHQTAPSSNSPPTANSFLPAALASATAWLAIKSRQQTVRLGPA